MVIALFLLTVIVFFAVDYFLRKEDRVLKKQEASKKSPIFVSPDKALFPLVDSAKRLYHLSHSWAQKTEEEYVYVGYDNFIPYVFSSKVKITDLPLIGSEVPQGTKIWSVQAGDRQVAQLAPIAGKVVEINPAFSLDMDLPSDQIEKSWILKMKSADYEHDTHNLMPNEQAMFINSALKEEFSQTIHHGDYLHDGGQIDPSVIKNMTDEEWRSFTQKYFPFQ
jgi:glycine cleavage system H lipoate-binding protein